MGRDEAQSGVVALEPVAPPRGPGDLPFVMVALAVSKMGLKFGNRKQFGRLRYMTCMQQRSL